MNAIRRSRGYSLDLKELKQELEIQERLDKTIQPEGDDVAQRKCSRRQLPLNNSRPQILRAKTSVNYQNG